MDPRGVSEVDLSHEAVGLCALAIDMLRHARRAFTSHDREHLAAAEQLGRLLRARERALSQQIVRRGTATGIVLEADRARLFVPVHLERGEGYLEVLLQSIRQMIVEGVPFTDRARHELEEMLDASIDLLQDLRDLLLTRNKHLRQHVIDAGRAFVARADDCAEFHQQRLIEGVCTAAASSIYLAILDSLKGMEWHAGEIARKLERLTAADVEDIEPVLDAGQPASLAVPRRDRDGERAKPSPVGWVP